MQVQGIFTDTGEETVRLNNYYTEIKKLNSKYLDHTAFMNDEVKT